VNSGLQVQLDGVAAQDRAGGDEWSVAYAPLGATRHKSSHFTGICVSMAS